MVNFCSSLPDVRKGLESAVTSLHIHTALFPFGFIARFENNFDFLHLASSKVFHTGLHDLSHCFKSLAHMIADFLVGAVVEAVV